MDKHEECDCCEEKLHGGEEDVEIRSAVIKIAAAGVLFIASFFVHDFSTVAHHIMLLAAYLIVGLGVIISAAKELIHEHSIDEEFLMTIATVGAIAIGETTEAVAVMLFYSVGELLEDIACEKSRRSITSLLALRPDTVTLKRDGGLVTVPIDEVRAGDVAVVVAGERIAVDGVIRSGTTEVDNSALTGESLPVTKTVGDEVYGGGINTSGTVEIEVTKPYGESSAARILELVENAQDKKARTERFITKFARKYTVGVVLLALIIAFVCPIFTGYAETFTSWFYRGLTLLVVSCPCAFVISVPLCFFAGIGCASRHGILVKGASSLESMAKLKNVAFDKTGTVTKGELAVVSVEGGDEILNLAAHVESRSNHPIAKAIVRANKGDVDTNAVDSAREEAGRGITATIGGDEIYVGKGQHPVEGLAVCVHKNGEHIGRIHLKDELKPDSKAALASLRNLGSEKIVMLSGDREESAREVAEAVGIDDVRAGLSPEQKCEELEKIRGNGVTAFVGDGINDAPVLAAADIGVAMGGLGSDAAIETADVVILDDSLPKLPLAMRISRRTMKIVYQCVAFAFIAKLAVIVLELAGLAGMWSAVFADVGVTVLAILNALRVMRIKE